MSKEIELLKSLFHINKMLHKEMSKCFLNEGLNSTEVMLLYRIKHGCDNLRTIDLAKEMGIPASTFTGMIDRLVEKGFVVRERNDKDRRSVCLKVNDDLQFKAENEKLTSSHMKGIMSCLAENDKENLFIALRKFEEALALNTEK